MIFGFGIGNKRVKDLRKDQGLTARELALRVKVETVEILKIDEMKLKDVPEPLKGKITPILKGKHMDRIPW